MKLQCSYMIVRGSTGSDAGSLLSCVGVQVQGHASNPWKIAGGMEDLLHAKPASETGE